jgi:hypothetical protein
MPSPAPRPMLEPAAALAPLSSPAIAPSPLPAPAASAVPVPRLDEEMLVKAALQRYRTAYEGLDARSARAVYPAVNEAALSRAFNGLESQSLTFDACDISVRGEAAAVTCRGSARYVPKIGNREPRVEPRVWSFALRKSDGDWKIDSARADR